MTREEKNVFRNAKFGDKFLTRNGQVMIYQKQSREDVYCLFDECGDFVIEYRPNGDVIYEYAGEAEPQEDDIVDRYPSLPSNIDGAAEEYAYNNWDDNDYHTGASEGLPFDAIGHTEKCFKAGAEWMAGQFQKIEGELVDWYSSPEGKDYCCGVKTIDSFEVPEGFYIRKK